MGLNVLRDEPINMTGIRPQPIILTQAQKNLSAVREFGPLLEHFKAVHGSVPFMKDPAIMQEKKLLLLREMPRGDYVLFPFQNKDGLPAAQF